MLLFAVLTFDAYTIQRLKAEIAKYSIHYKRKAIRHHREVQDTAFDLWMPV